MKFTDLRKKKYYTQESLAIELGVSQSTVAMWESGKSVPSLKNLKKLSEILGVNLTSLCKSLEER